MQRIKLGKIKVKNGQNFAGKLDFYEQRWYNKLKSKMVKLLLTLIIIQVN